MGKWFKQIILFCIKRKPFWKILWNSESEDAKWEIFHDLKKETVTLLYVPEEDYTKNDIKITVNYDEFNDLLKFTKKLNRRHYTNKRTI